MRGFRIDGLGIGGSVELAAPTVSRTSTFSTFVCLLWFRLLAVLFVTGILPLGADLGIQSPHLGIH